jgi:hypothetical protein
MVRPASRRDGRPLASGVPRLFKVMKKRRLSNFVRGIEQLDREFRAGDVGSASEVGHQLYAPSKCRLNHFTTGVSGSVFRKRLFATNGQRYRCTAPLKR